MAGLFMACKWESGLENRIFYQNFGANLRTNPRIPFLEIAGISLKPSVVGCDEAVVFAVTVLHHQVKFVL